MKATQFEHCERTGRIVGHCGCADCYARRLAKLVRTDPALRTPTRRGESPRYLVINAL